jgi:LCP family protein required for cell wall assembly
LGRFAVALVLVFVLTTSGIAAAYWFANDKVNDIPTAPIDKNSLRKDEKGKPANFLIIGSDTRSFVKDENAREVFGDVGGERSDTIMVAHIDPASKQKGLLVSFPRDLYVDIPGHGHDKINAAFSLGGPQLVIDTLKHNFDIPINHYLEVNFEGFAGIVDAIGAVDVYFPTPARDTYTGLVVLSAGCYPLDGENALKYVRSRYYEWYDERTQEWKDDPGWDLSRIGRQQYFMRSLAQKAIDSGARDPRKAFDVLDQVVKHLRRDTELKLGDLQALIRTFRNVDPGVVETTTVPVDADRIDGASVLVMRDDEAAPLLERLRSFGAPKTPAPLPDIAPSEIAVQVLNGSGVSGQAAQTSARLVELGFREGAAPGNAGGTLDETEIRYAPGAEAKARLVGAYVGSTNLVPLADAPDGVDVVVATGTDFSSVEDPSATTSTTTTSTTTPPTTTPLTTAFRTDPNAGRPLVGCP